MQTLKLLSDIPRQGPQWLIDKFCMAYFSKKLTSQIISLVTQCLMDY
jgi:hypothetical protein